MFYIIAQIVIKVKLCYNKNVKLTGKTADMRKGVRIWSFPQERIIFMEIINPSGKKTVRLSTEWLGRELTLEVNRVGFRTTSSVLVTYGDTVVLGSVVVGTKPVVQDFFPL